MVNGLIQYSPFNIRHSAFLVFHGAYQYPCLFSASRGSTGSRGDAEEAEKNVNLRLLRFLRVTRLLFCSEARTQCREALRFFAPVLLASRLLARAGALLLPAFFFAPGLAVARAFAARFETAAGFLCDSWRFGARRGRGAAFGFASFIVASILTSVFVSSRQTPGVSFGSESGPMATRLSFMTG